MTYQRYQFEAWPVGSYTTTNFIGSRGGGPVASAWAVMKYLGFEGYRARVANMLEAKRRLIAGIAGIAGLQVFGVPDGTHFSFGSSRFDMTAVAGEMSRLGWSFARQVDPPGMLLLLNGYHVAVVDDFLRDLDTAVAGVTAGRILADSGPAVYTV